MRLTETVDRRRSLYRGRRVTLHGWTLPEDNEFQEISSTEWVCSKKPLVLYLQVPGAQWQISGLDVGVYPLTPRSRTWIVNKVTGCAARRTGFFVTPDFACTSHAVQGDTLEAVWASPKRPGLRTNLQDMVTAYVIFSRVRSGGAIKLLNAFAPKLFQSGPPVGASMLLKKLRGELLEEDIEEAFKTAEEQQESRHEKDLLDDIYICQACTESAGTRRGKAARDFGVRKPADVWNCILKDGFWTKCSECKLNTSKPRLTARNATGKFGGRRGAAGGEGGRDFGELGAARGRMLGERGAAHGALGKNFGGMGAASGVRGAASGAVSAASGDLGAAAGGVGAASGAVGAAFGVLGAASGVLGASSGVVGAASGLLGATHGALGTASGVEGAVLGVLGEQSGTLGTASGVLGAAFGALGKASGALGAACGVNERALGLLGIDHGVLGKEHGVQGAPSGVLGKNMESRENTRERWVHPLEC